MAESCWQLQNYEGGQVCMGDHGAGHCQPSWSFSRWGGVVLCLQGPEHNSPWNDAACCAQEHMALLLRAGSQLLRGYGCKDLHVGPGEGGSPGPQDDET